MGSGYDRENYEELYAIRARVESIDAQLKGLLSELMKIRKLLEGERAEKFGHGAVDPSEGMPRQAESPYRMPEQKKKFGIF
jgi:hypothetical protein